MTGIWERRNNQSLNKTGQIVDYDVCSTSDLQTAKDFYGESFQYVASGYVTYHDGVRNEWDELHHFFIKKPTAKILFL